MTIPTQPRLHETLAYADSVTPTPGLDKAAVLAAFTDEVMRLRQRVSALESTVADLTSMCLSLRDELKLVRATQVPVKSVVYLSRPASEESVWSKAGPRSRR